MSDIEVDAEGTGESAPSLTEAMDRIRTAQADRDDVVIDMKQAARVRLELLAREIKPVLDQIPDDVDWIEAGLSSGDPPRLWIDVTTHVRMGRDRRIYELVKDTRLGRTILGQSEHKETITELVTDYVAERLLERKRAMEGEWVSLIDLDNEEVNSSKQAPKTETRKTPTGLRSFLWFMGGIFTTALLMFIWAWYGQFPT